jgi:putative restriction endonuclease
MVKLFVGMTDKDWYDYLSHRPGIEEVNFWQPSGRTKFRALRPGELFLFKLHSPNNFIVGGGIFAHASLAPTSLAWEAFGESNGASSLLQMRERVARYRREPFDPRADHQIGCRLLEQPFFFPPEDWIPVPESWAPSIVVGKGFDTDEPEGRGLWDAIQIRLAARQLPTSQEIVRFGPPRLIAPRLGQGTFRIAVTDSYERRCAVTGEKTLPILDAAHIRAFSDGGSHELDNGILLRTDIHRLFDLGYVTATTDGRFEVGRRLKEDFDNGRHYYELHGQRLIQPKQINARASAEALEWHQNNRFLG